jgi:hypothetical protein
MNKNVGKRKKNLAQKKKDYVTLSGFKRQQQRLNCNNDNISAFQLCEQNQFSLWWLCETF